MNRATKLIRKSIVQRDEQEEEDLDMLDGLRLTRDQIFALKFAGEIVYDNDIFKTLKAYTPTGMEKRLASTKFNMMRYERFLKSMKTYMSKASEKGRDIQELALRAIPDSDKEDESDACNKKNQK